MQLLSMLTEADREFICRALGMHAALTSPYARIKNVEQLTCLIKSWTAGVDQTSPSPSQQYPSSDPQSTCDASSHMSQGS
jgi:hypothetical protein